MSYTDRMGRPREFEEDEVLRKSLEVFWARGFEGTSIDDLVKATGLGRASLYSAFEDKAGLYAATLRFYLRQGAGALRLLEGPSPKNAVYTYFMKAVQGGCSKQGPRGCFALQAAMEESHSDVARTLLQQDTQNLLAAFEAVIERGQEAKEFTKEKSARELAQYLYLLRVGAAGAARVGLSPKALMASIESGLQVLET